MVFGREIKFCRFADFFDDDIAGLVRGDGGFRTREIRHAPHYAVIFLLFFGQLFLFFFQFFTDFPTLGDNGGAFVSRCGFDGIAQAVFFFCQCLGGGF